MNKKEQILCWVLFPFIPISDRAKSYVLAKVEQDRAARIQNLREKYRAD